MRTMIRSARTAIDPELRTGATAGPSDPFDSVARDDTGTDVLFGAGLNVAIGERTALHGEYVHLPMDDDVGGEHHRFQLGVNFAY